jgi:hypothetical protein
MASQGRTIRLVAYEAEAEVIGPFSSGFGALANPEINNRRGIMVAHFQRTKGP